MIDVEEEFNSSINHRRKSVSEDRCLMLLVGISNREWERVKRIFLIVDVPRLIVEHNV